MSGTHTQRGTKGRIEEAWRGLWRVKWWEIRGSGEHGRDTKRLEKDLLKRVKEGHEGDDMDMSVGVGGHKG